MVKACCVKNCQSNGRNTNGKISLHLFPTTNLELMGQWINFLGYGSDWKPPKYAAICSHHFNKSDFSVNTNIRRLLSSAVPSVKTELIINKPRKKSNKSKKKSDQKKDDTDTNDHSANPENRVEDDEMCHDVKKTCRLCGFEYKTELKYIFEHDNSYAERINKYLCLSISQDDSLPLSLCILCQSKFNDFEKFKNDVDKAQEDLWKRFPLEKKINFENDIAEMPIEIEKDSKIQLDNRQNPNFNNNQIIFYPVLSINNNAMIATNDVPLNRTDAENNNVIKEYVPSFSKSYYNSNEKQYRQPIKMETITPMTDLCPNSHLIKSSSTNNNKKIEILQDIKLDLNQISLKSIKSIYEESLKIHELKAKCEKIEAPRKNIHMKKHKYDKVNTLLTKSTLVCKQCCRKFISKYSLSHHIKYICGIDDKCANKCHVCNKIISNKVEKSKFACKCNHRVTKTSQKRKAYQPVKLEYHPNYT